MGSTIMITGCKIEDSQVGDCNTMIHMNDNKLNDKDWDNIKEVLNKRLEDTKGETCQLVKQAKEYAEKKDETNFKALLSKHFTDFSKNIFYNLAGTAISNALTKLGLKFF